MLLALSGMADGTVNRGNVDRGVGEGGVLMAKCAADPSRSMHRVRQILGGDKELSGPVRPLEHGRVPVAHEAHLVINLCR